MKVKELIEILNTIENKELDVMIWPDPELFIEENIAAYGEVAQVKEKVLYLDVRDHSHDGGIWKEKDSLIDYNCCDIEDEFQTDDIDTLSEETINSWVEGHDKMHAVIIKATP